MFQPSVKFQHLIWQINTQFCSLKTNCPWCLALANRLSFSCICRRVCLPRLLYRRCHYLCHFLLTCTSHSSLSGSPPWGPRKPGTRLNLSASPGQLGSGGSSLQFCSVLTDPFSLGPTTLNSAFYFQPASEHNTEEPCADTHPWAYMHIHTIISHWKGQDQKRKEEQTPLRCWAWLRVPLDTGGCTQDNCCLLFMEGPSATLHAFFIWSLLKGHSQEPQEKRKMKLPLYVYCTSVCGCLNATYTYCTVVCSAAVGLGKPG